MPVNELLCEGAPGSADARILNKLLAGLTQTVVRPSGHKYGMGYMILARREARPRQGIAGIIDGDFRENWPASVETSVPATWEDRDQEDSQHQYGWRWSRKNIENYLIDPQIVSRALGAQAPDETRYRDMLDRAASELGVYTAARTALTMSRRRFRPLSNRWGRRRGRDKILCPDDLTESACREEIRNLVASHGSEHAVTEEDAIGHFERLKPEFTEGGRRREDFLWTYDGKDILVHMDQELRSLRYDGYGAFTARIVKSIEESDEDIGTWLTEWGILRERILQFQPAPA